MGWYLGHKGLLAPPPPSQCAHVARFCTFFKIFHVRLEKKLKTVSFFFHFFLHLSLTSLFPFSPSPPSLSSKRFCYTHITKEICPSHISPASDGFRKDGNVVLLWEKLKEGALSRRNVPLHRDHQGPGGGVAVGGQGGGGGGVGGGGEGSEQPRPDVGEHPGVDAAACNLHLIWAGAKVVFVWLWGFNRKRADSGARASSHLSRSESAHSYMNCSPLRKSTTIQMYSLLNTTSTAATSSVKFLWPGRMWAGNILTIYPLDINGKEVANFSCTFSELHFFAESPDQHDIFLTRFSVYVIMLQVLQIHEWEHS